MKHLGAFCQRYSRNGSNSATRSEKERWQGIFRTGIILNQSLRKHLKALDELHTEIRDLAASDEDELNDFLNQADWGLGEVDAIVGNRQYSDERSQNASENDASGSEVGSTVPSSHTGATLQ